MNRDAVWMVLRKLGCPTTLITMFKEIHLSIKTLVTFNGELSDEIAIDHGVKQGDIPTFTLFSIYFAVILLYAFRECIILIGIGFRTTVGRYSI